MDLFGHQGQKAELLALRPGQLEKPLLPLFVYALLKAGNWQTGRTSRPIMLCCFLPNPKRSTKHWDSFHEEGSLKCSSPVLCFGANVLTCFRPYDSRILMKCHDAIFSLDSSCTLWYLLFSTFCVLSIWGLQCDCLWDEVTDTWIGSWPLFHHPSIWGVVKLKTFPRLPCS